MFPYKVSYIQNPYVHIYGSVKKKKKMQKVLRHDICDEAESTNV